MDTNKMREEFEAWFCKKIGVDQDYLVRSRTDEGDNGWPYRIRGTDGEENYEVSAQVGVAWLSWEASRAAVVVELPDPNEVHDSGDYCAETIDAIEAQGLKVAP